MTRRAMLALSPVSLAAAVASLPQKGPQLPQAGEFVRFLDPTTEIVVVRLATPAYNHYLPAASNRFVSLKPRVLYCSSDRVGGRGAPFQIDLRTGLIRQMAETEALDPASLCLDAPARSLYFLDGGGLNEVSALGKREPKRGEALAHDVSAFSPGSSRGVLFAISRGRLLRLGEGQPVVLAEAAAAPCLAHPGDRGCIFARQNSETDRAFWYAPADQAAAKPVLLAQGRISNPRWSSDGESLLFLRDVPKNDVFVSEIHQVNLETPVERCVSVTSQFATFSANENDSVFVGASKSKAQPNIVLLLRSSRRELTLCEHRSMQPSTVQPTFSPDSRRVYFQSNREGKNAIYSVNVEQLVEPTS